MDIGQFVISICVINYSYRVLRRTMTVTYYKISQDQLRKEYEALQKRHKKLESLHQGLGERVSVAEKQAKIDENTATKAEAALKAANFTISAETDELRTRMRKEHTQRLEQYDDQVRGLYATIKNNTKLFERLQKKYDDMTADWAVAHNKSKKLQVELTEQKILIWETGAKLRKETGKRKKLEKEAKRVIPENIQITTLENKYNKLYNKVVEAKKKITTLNANTPYRPGRVERVLADVIKEMENV